MANQKWYSALVLVGMILLCESVGILGALSTNTGSSPWYQSLRKPSFNPPGWVFGPVWTTLYAMMGIALFLVWRTPAHTPGRRIAIALFFVQLILNGLWTPAFFGMRSTLAGLIVIIPLWLAIVATLARFWDISRVAAILLIPYLLWVSFATVLNTSLHLLNR